MIRIALQIYDLMIIKMKKMPILNLKKENTKKRGRLLRTQEKELLYTITKIYSYVKLNLNMLGSYRFGLKNEF